jgi:hypothetical protein
MGGKEQREVQLSFPQLSEDQVVKSKKGERGRKHQPTPEELRQTREIAREDKRFDK